MDIDNNDLAKKAMGCFTEKKAVQGEKLLKEFLDLVRNSNQDYCSCATKCRYHGKCVECVIIHRGHQEHLPNCFYDMVNDKISHISCLTEHSFKKHGKK
jgi:hypothetical protein